MRTVYLEVEVDLGDALDAATEDELRAELDARGANNRPREAAIDAINQIRAGRYADAITTLEREFLPKWESVDQCRRQHAEAMAMGLAV